MTASMRCEFTETCCCSPGIAVTFRGVVRVTSFTADSASSTRVTNVSWPRCTSPLLFQANCLVLNAVHLSDQQAEFRIQIRTDRSHLSLDRGDHRLKTIRVILRDRVDVDSNPCNWDKNSLFSVSRQISTTGWMSITWAEADVGAAGPPAPAVPTRAADPSGRIGIK